MHRTLHASCSEARKHAKCSVVGDVARPRCSNALPMLDATRLAFHPDANGRSGVCHESCLRQLSRATHPLISRADVAGNANVYRPRYYPPDVARSLRTSPVMQMPITETGTERSTSSGKGVVIATSIYMYPERAPDARSPKRCAPAPVLLDGHRHQ